MSVAPETIRTMEKERQEQKAPLEPPIDNKDLDTHPTDNATPDEFDPEFAPELDYGDHHDICADENDDSMSDDGEMFQRQRSDNEDSFEEEQEAYSFEEEQESREGDERREGESNTAGAQTTPGTSGASMSSHESDSSGSGSDDDGRSHKESHGEGSENETHEEGSEEDADEEGSGKDSDEESEKGSDSSSEIDSSDSDSETDEDDSQEGSGSEDEEEEKDWEDNPKTDKEERDKVNAEQSAKLLHDIKETARDLWVSSREHANNPELEWLDPIDTKDFNTADLEKQFGKFYEYLFGRDRVRDKIKIRWRKLSKSMATSGFERSKAKQGDKRKKTGFYININKSMNNPSIKRSQLLAVLLHHLLHAYLLIGKKKKTVMDKDKTRRHLHSNRFLKLTNKVKAMTGITVPLSHSKLPAVNDAHRDHKWKCKRCGFIHESTRDMAPSKISKKQLKRGFYGRLKRHMRKCKGGNSEFIKIADKTGNLPVPANLPAEPPIETYLERQKRRKEKKREKGKDKGKDKGKEKEKDKGKEKEKEKEKERKERKRKRKEQQKGKDKDKGKQRAEDDSVEEERPRKRQKKVFTTVDGVRMTVHDGIYHEHQHKLLCGMHVVNNLLQRHRYNQAAMNALGVHLEAADGLPANSLWSPDGNYAIDVLELALRRENISVTQLQNDLVNGARDLAQEEEAFIVHQNHHWVAFRRFEGVWYILDSTARAPEQVETAYMSALLQQLLWNGFSIFAVRGNLPLHRAATGDGGATAGGAGPSAGPSGSAAAGPSGSAAAGPSGSGSAAGPSGSGAGGAGGSSSTGAA
ncbi:Josephin-domain-containing protein [Fimicolochytrium jonesii]|uniref:Josephin-domain-containing protein n=1 Tax=Fimicolochytrium jonesii TaxID=1396493 RepID=UPI0022FF17AB|nr:Josephin-domain-containing protein [Fimicolochytrium jonesii]KAI8817177.1 Josephin-domain-containing protein [Fimicolochytrium jonesii]